MHIDISKVLQKYDYTFFKYIIKSDRWVSKTMLTYKKFPLNVHSPKIYDFCHDLYAKNCSCMAYLHDCMINNKQGPKWHQPWPSRQLFLPLSAQNIKTKVWSAQKNLLLEYLSSRFRLFQLILVYFSLFQYNPA